MYHRFTKNITPHNCSLSVGHVWCIAQTAVFAISQEQTKTLGECAFNVLLIQLIEVAPSTRVWVLTTVLHYRPVCVATAISLCALAPESENSWKHIHSLTLHLFLDVIQTVCFWMRSLSGSGSPYRQRRSLHAPWVGRCPH